ncbi:hypothetical protein FH968_23515 [Buttiauxella sp. B2]|uniref:hypothetical protein n=1 Tax=Buttiauxella sp. B2 TaxID=2587812 RepID=UPI0011215B8E|nr:hypothetical protein [Buttiauxella sp. B2]TNV09037.1 hypothetical protein FH968_23515 [Buttiauxella sp. B2]
MKMVETRNLATPGKPAGQVELFHIILNDCNTSVYTNVQVSFNGQTDTTFKSVLVTLNMLACNSMARMVKKSSPMTLPLWC